MSPDEEIERFSIPEAPVMVSSGHRPPPRVTTVFAPQPASFPASRICDSGSGDFQGHH